MDSKVEIKGDADVVIGQNHAPIIVNNTFTVTPPEGGLASTDGESTQNREVYFMDLTIPELKEKRAERVRWIRNARIKIFTSVPTIVFALLILIPLITIIRFSLWGEIFHNQYYVYIWAVIFMINAYVGQQSTSDYLQFIQHTKMEIAGIDQAITRKKMMSR